jgi:hypothetical protein
MPSAPFAPSAPDVAVPVRRDTGGHRRTTGYDSDGLYESLGLGETGLPAVPDDGPVALGAVETDGRVLPLTLSSVLFTLGEFGQGSDPRLYCQVCHLAVESRMALYVRGAGIHPECLKCWKCEAVIAPPECVSWGRGILCKPCSEGWAGTICEVCGKLIDPYEKVAERLDSKIVHEACRVCYECGSAVQDPELVGTEEFCGTCAAKVRRRVCEKCGQIVIGDGFEKAGKWFHIDHLTCRTCHAVLRPAAAIVHHGKFYCAQHGALFAQSCDYCKELIGGATVPQLAWHGKLYHRECFVCRVCGVALSPLSARKAHNRPHCLACFELRVEERRRGEQAVRHVPGESARRRQRFAEGGVEIVEEPLFRGQQPLLETVASERMNAKKFEPHVPDA